MQAPYFNTGLNGKVLSAHSVMLDAFIAAARARED
jgi:hypothetical protein